MKSSYLHIPAGSPDGDRSSGAGRRRDPCAIGLRNWTGHEVFGRDLSLTMARATASPVSFGKFHERIFVRAKAGAAGGGEYSHF